ncbi:hemagglutinin repeat-containing protein, partial [Dickeya solani]|uniref:hemagglutinin repeat-containing protein n=1 Tax=Dickeya solani TaxID=1089444 RepID=UPI0039FC33C7
MGAASLRNGGQIQSDGSLAVMLAGGLSNSGTLAANGDTVLTLGGLDNRGTVSALGRLTVQGATLDNGGQLAGGDALTLSGDYAGAGRVYSDGALTLRGNGVVGEGGRWQGKTVTVTGGTLSNGGQLNAAEALTLELRGALGNTGTLAGQTATVRAASLDNGGLLSGRDGLTVTLAGALSNGGRLEGRALGLTADTLDNGGTLLGMDALTLAIAGTARNQASGQWLSNGESRLTAAELDNRGTVSGRQVTLTADTLSNGGTLSADGTLTVQAQTQLDNSGSLLAGGALTVQAGQTANRGVMAGDTLSVTADGLDNSGTLQGRQAVTLTADGALTNTATGKLLTQGAAVLNAAAAENDGEWQAGNLLLTADSLRNGGRIQSDGALTAALSATGMLTNRGTLAANGDTTLTLGGLDNRGAVSALGGLTVQGTTLGNAGQLASRGALTLTGDYAGGGSLYSEAALTLRGADIANAGGRWQGSTIDITGQQLDNQGTLVGGRIALIGQQLANTGNITGLDSLTVTLPGTLTNRGRLEGKTLSLTADSLDNGGTLLGMDALTLAIAGTARNQASGRWLSQGVSRLTAGTLDNQGQWQGDSLTATAARIRNAGQLLGLSALTLTAHGALANTATGTLLTQGAAVLTAATVDNDGEWQSGRLRLTADGLRNGGRIQSDGALDVALSPAGVLTNTGTLAANGDTTLTLGGLDNRGAVSVRGDLTVTGTDLDNAGQLAAQGALTLTGHYAGAGSLYSDAALTLRGATLANDGGRWQGHTVAIGGGQLTNSGTVTGLDSLTVTTTGALTSHGRLESRTLSLTADMLDNGGTLLGMDALTLAIAGTARNQASGQWLSNGESRLTAAELDNQGQWQGARLEATAGTVRNAGQLLGLSALTLTAGGTLTNTATGKLLTQGAAVLNAATAENDGEWQAGNLLLTAGSLRNGGRIQSDGALTATLSAAGTLTNSGTLAANGDTTLTLGGLDNRGTVSGLGNLTVAGADLHNEGQLASGGALTLTGDYAGGGSLYSDGALTLSGNGVVGDGGRWQGKTVTITGDTLSNGGRLSAAEALTLELRGALGNTGTLAGQTLMARAAALDNGGLLSGREGLTVTLPGTLTNHGRLEGQTLSLTAETLDNGGTLLGMDALTLAIAGTARNQTSGQWLSNGESRLTAAALDNQGRWQGDRLHATAGTVHNAGQLLGLSALTLTAGGALTNTATGKLLTQGAAVLNAATAENDGEWQAGTLQLTADSLRNGGQIHSDGDLAVTLPATGSDPLRAMLRAVQQLAQDVQAASPGSLTNTGTLTAGGDSRITGRRLDNQGTLAASGALSLAAGDMTNAGRLDSRTLLLTGDSLDNRGTLLAEQGGVLTLGGGLRVGADGRLLSNGDWQVQAGSVNSRGQWQGKNLLLSAASLDNGGALLGTDGITLTLTQGYTGGAGSQVLGSGAVTLTADTVTQQGDIGGDRLQLTTGTLTNGGRLVGLSQLDVTSRGQLTNTAGGSLLGNGTAGVTAQQLDNAGSVQADTLTLRADTVTNAGRMQGTSALTLNGVSRYTGNADSQLLSGGTATLAIDNADNAGLWQAGVLNVSGTSLTNHGTLLGQRGLQLEAASLTNLGQLTTQGMATLRGRQFDNGGTLTALGGFDAQFSDAVTNQAGGRLLSGGAGSLATGTLLNQGLWQSGRLTLTADRLRNPGTLLGLDDGNIQLTGTYVGEAGSQVGGNGAFSLSAATIDQAGHLQAQDVTLRAARLRNQGGITGAGQLNVTLDEQLENTAGATLLGGTVSLGGATVSNGGQIQGRSGLTVQGGTLLDNQSGGQLLSGGQLTLGATQLTNAGWVQGQDLTLTTAQLDNSGTLQAQNGLTLHLPQWTNHGTVQAGQLDITTDGALDNRGTLLGLTRLALQAASLNNADGARLYSAGGLQLRTGQLTQDGQLAALGDLRADIGGPFTLTRALAAGGQLTLAVTGDLVQAGTLQGNGVTVTSTGTLTQQGRIVAGGGNSLLSAATITQAESGSIQGGGPLRLLATGNIVNRGFVGTAGDLLVQAGGLIENGSLLYGGGDLQLLSAALVNRFGNILAGNSLWIQRDAAGNASDSVLNSSGTIETQRGDIRISTGTLTNQREGLVVTEGESTTEVVPDWVGGDRVEIPLTWFKEGELGIAEFYTGCLRGGKASGASCGDSVGYLLAPFAKAAIQKVSLASKSVSVSAQGGEARINSANDALITSNVLLNDASAIYARNNIVLYGDSLNNRTYQAGDLKRYITYRYDSVEFVYGTWSWINDFASDDQSAYVGGGSSPITKQLDLADKFGIQNKHYSINYKPTGESTSELINGQTYAATIQAGGAITASFTQNISNTSLQPGSGGFMPAMATPTLAGVNALAPVGVQADRGLNGGAAGNVSGSTLSGAGNGVALAGQAGSLNAGYSAVTRDNSTSSGSTLNPVGIPAGLGTAGGAPVAGASLTPVAPGALSLSDLQAALAQGLQQPGSPSLTDYPLPTSQNGLFVADTAGDSRYLIRTNPTLSQLGQVDNALFGDLRGLLGQTPGTTAPVERSPTLTDPTQVLGSSYLLGKLNLDAEHDYRFLGDAAFDTRYISNAVLSQTGQRYLNGVGSELAQMQQLMDNAAAEKSRLNLQLGVSLTPAQVAGLSHSLVWWENITVGGQTVLAPKLYLAQADKTNLQGSRIVANSVSLSAGGDIDNRGSTITAQDALAVASGGNLTNSEGGLLNAGGALNLVALGNLTNSSATIQGNTVTLASVGGDIVNTTTTDQWQFESRNGRERLNHTDIGQTGLINAQSALTLQAGHDIALNGAQLSAGGPLQLAAGNDIRLTALTTLADTVRQDGGATTERRGQGLVQSTVASGGDLSLSAGRDLSSTAAQLSAAGTLGLSAGRDLSLLSAGEEQFSSNAWKRHLDWQQTVTQQGTVLNAGEGLSLRAGQDLTLQGAQVETRGALTAQAGRDLSLLSATESRHDFFEETTVKKGFLSTSTTHTLRDTQQTTEKGTLLSGGSVALTAGHDINLQASAIAGDKSVALKAGNDVNLIAGIEEQSHYEEQTRKKSGLMSSGGLGFTIGSQSSKAIYDGAETRQSAARSVVGASDGNVVIQAGRNVAIIGSDVIAASQTPTDGHQTGNISVIAENIAVAPGIDTRDITTRLETKSSGIGIALKGTPYDNYQNLRDIANVDGATQKARLFAGEMAAMVFDVPQLAISVGRQISQSVQHTQGVYQSGSTLTAAGNIQLRANGNGQQDAAGNALSGDIVASGSAIHAGGDVLLNAARNIVLQSASDAEQTGRQSSSHGTSFSLATPGISAAIRQIGGGPNHGVGMVPFASERARETQSGDTQGQTPSTISGQTVTLNSQTGDIHVVGSAITGVQDVLLQASNGNVVITPGQNRARSEINGSRSVIGDLGGDGYSGTVGWKSTTYHSLDDVNQQSVLRSHIQSGEGNVRVSAGENVAIAGADFRAGQSLLLSGRNVTLDPATDTEHRTREQQSRQYGVTTALSGYVVSAVQSLEKLSQSVEDHRDPRLSAIYAAQAALNLATKTTVTQMSGSAIKVTVSAGGGSSRSVQQQDKVSREGSTLYADGDVQVRAAQDISATGVDIRGQNVDLAAGRTLTLKAAQSQDSVSGSSSGSQFGAGVGFGLGGTQNGFTIELSASGQKGQEAGNSLNHQVSRVTAAGAVNLSSGGDTTLDGAVVSGNRVSADVGGNLHISSVQDTSTYASKNTSAGINVSICVPPICAGQTVAGNASLSQQILNNRYASVTEQSGVKAGEDGFAIRVGGHTQLDGAVLASTAGAEKNRLETGTLGWRDIANVSNYQGRGVSLSASTDSMPVGGLSQSVGKASGTTRSAVAPGTILVRDASQPQDIAQLSRDTSGALGSVADGFTRSEVEDRLTIQKEMTSLGVQAMGAYGENKKREAETAAAQRLSREGVPAGEMESRIKSSEEVRQAEANYGPGSAYWTTGTALTA